MRKFSRTRLGILLFHKDKRTKKKKKSTIISKKLEILVNTLTTGMNKRNKRCESYFLSIYQCKQTINTTNGTKTQRRLQSYTKNYSYFKSLLMFTSVQ